MAAIINSAGMAAETTNQINATYTEDYCHALELAYGPNMMAEGGTEAIDELFFGIDLHGLVALDFGSGLGGVAQYLARKYGTCVTGVEINPSMIETATKRIPYELRDKIQFILSLDGKRLPFPTGSFDVVYSKGVLVHLTAEQKAVVFREFYRVLKPGGQLVIGDWLSPTDSHWDEYMQRLIESEGLPLYAQTFTSFQEQLKLAGFKDIHYKDYTHKATRQNRDVITNLEHPTTRIAFKTTLGEDHWYDHLAGYKNIVAAHEKGELSCGHFRAFKD